MEIWKDIQGFEGLYQVSNFGNVKNRKGRILRPATRNDMRKQVILWKNGKAFTRKIHRLVAIAFLPNPNGYLQINHKDEDPTNNNVENLEWCDELYNHHYGTAIQRMADAMKGKFLSEKSILSKRICQYSLNGDYIKEWACANDVKRELKISNANISLCCTGRRKSAGGFIWKYKEEA